MNPSCAPSAGRGGHRLAVPATLAALLLAHPGAAAVAQTPGPEEIREHLLQDWERQRSIVLEYVAAMPEEHFGFRPTPEVRSFSEQIEHIVRDNVAIAATAFDRGDRPDLGEADAYLSSKDALAGHVRAGYDYVLELLEEVSGEELLEEGVVFGRYRVPRWRALEGAHEHATWTLGQTIPYLRLNGVEPPPYVVFPSNR